jgi:DNA-binding MarR family transcriptional regulator
MEGSRSKISPNQHTAIAFYFRLHLPIGSYANMDRDSDEGELRLQLRDLGSYLMALADGETAGEPLEHLRAIPMTKGLRSSVHLDDTPRLRTLALSEYRRRQSRAEHFDGGLFAEPAWDILLDLFVANIDGIRVSITSACLATSCPPTTALRWVTVLEDQELVARAGDAKDQRRSWLHLTELGLKKMTAYLRGKEVVRSSITQSARI